MKCAHCDQEKEKAQVCGLCKKVAFCDDQCEKKAWALHQNECNTHTTVNGSTLALPYMYEDVAPQEVLDQQPQDLFIFQNHLLREHNTNGTIVQRSLQSIAGLFEGLTSSNKKPLDASTYQISISDNDTGKTGTVSGSVENDTVKLGSTNVAAERLAGAGLSGGLKPFAKTLKNRAQYVTTLWPSPLSVQKELSHIPVEKDHTYTVSVQIGDVAKSKDFRFALDYAPQRSLNKLDQKLLRQSKLGRFTQHMMKTQYAAVGAEVALERTGIYLVELDNGMNVILDVEDKNGVMTITNAQLMVGDDNYDYYANPRYSLPARGLPKVHNRGAVPISHKFVCDSTDINHVTGLTMALKERVADHEDVLDTLKKINRDPACNIIKELESKTINYKQQLSALQKHQEKLATGEEMPEDFTINALIAQVMDDQFAYIGSSMKENTYAMKILKDGVNAARDLADIIINNFQAAQERMREADEAKAASKDRAKGQKFGTRAKEFFKRGGSNIKKGAAFAAKKKAEADMRMLQSVLSIAANSTLVTDESIKQELKAQIDRVTNARERTRQPEAESEVEVEGDDMYKIQSKKWDY